MNIVLLSHLLRHEKRMQIFTAVDSLLDDCPFEKITITMICKKLGITRPTFYRYFSNKYEILQWHHSLIASIGISEIGRSLTWEQGYYETTKGVYQFRHLYQHIPYSFERESIHSLTERARIDTLIKTLNVYKKIVPTKEQLCQIAVTAKSEVTLTSRWMRDGMVEMPEEMAKLMTHVVPHKLYMLLETPETPSESALDTLEMFGHDNEWNHPPPEGVKSEGKTRFHRI
jgi:hypothetical protein